MSDINWGLIRSGETFEDLICALIRFEDHQASLYLRRGRDDGQDARSGDGRIVYQMKFHQNEDVASAIKDAKAEAKKIAGYKSTLGLKQDVWRGVQEWILVSNVTFNPRDRQKWINEVEPPFAQIGLIATYWEKGAIEALLHKYPDLKQAYFSGESRVFLGIAEAHEQLSNEFPHPNALNTHYQGREEDGNYKNFLESDSKKIFVIHGAGGIGKTRFLLEGAKREALPNGWQVLWANVGAMSTTSSWFSGLIVERPTLLLIDEPDDAKVLQTLVEQISSGRSQKWKVAIAVRSLNDPVLKYFQGSRIQQIVEKLDLKILGENAAVAFCRELLEFGSLKGKTPDWKTNAANWIAQRYDYYPIWIAIAVKVLEGKGDLKKMPEETERLATEYLEQILKQQQSIPADQVLILLQWIALLGTVNREDTTLTKLIQEKVSCENPTRLQRYFDYLITHKIIFARGARNRLLEIKPDIFADYILRNWLTYSELYGNNNLQASSDATKIIGEIATMLDSKDSEESLSFQTPSVLKLILRGIARFELIQDSLNKPVNLLGNILSNWYERVPNMNARRKLIYLGILDEISFTHVSDVLELLRVVLNSDSVSETITTIFGERTITNDDVILSLPGVIDNIAPYSQSIDQENRIISLLCKLIIKEHHIADRRTHGLPNDGKRSETVLARIITGGTEFRSNFRKPAFKQADQLLDNICSEGNISDDQKLCLNALVKPLLSIQQEHTLFDGRTIQIQRWFITPDESDESSWGTRDLLCKKIRKILSDRKLEPASAEILWSLLVYAHDEINQALLELSRDRIVESDEYQLFHTVLTEDLQWLVNLLKSHTLDIQELTAARKIWDWHYQFKRYPEIAAIADQCETLFKNNTLFPQYAPLLRWDDTSLSWQEYEENLKNWVIQISQNLINSKNPKNIHDFIHNGVKFLGNPDQISRLFIVAEHIGAQLPQSQAVLDFVEEALELDARNLEFQFSTRIARSWVWNTRKNDSLATITVLKQLLKWVKTSEKVAQLIQVIYENSWMIDIPEQEVELVLQQREYFLQANSSVCFIGLLGSIFPFSSSEKIKNTIEITLDNIDHKQLSNGLGAFLQSLNYAMRNYFKRCHAQKTEPTIDPSLKIWVLNQILRLPDIDNLSGTNVQYLKELLQIPLFDKPNLEWLVSAVEQRIQMASESEGFHIQILPGRERLSEWIAPISIEQNEEKYTTRNLISKLLSYTDSYPKLGYRLPQYLFDIDPNGTITVDLILEKLADPNVQNEPSKIWRWAKFAGYYSDSSTAWYKIAHEVCSLAEQFHERDKYSIFHALTSPKPKIWMSNMGEFPSTFEKAVETAKNRLESETDPIIVPFWQWMLQLAEAELSSEVERVKEEIEE